MRTKIFRLAVIGLFLLIISYLFYLQAIRGGYYFRLSKNNRIRVVALEGSRGKILDRNGIVLADNERSYQAVLTVHGVNDELFDFLSDVLNVDRSVVMKRFQSRRVNSFAPIVMAEDISIRQAIMIEENKYRFPNLYVQESFKRFYPLAFNSSHVLGYVGKINIAKLERLKEYGYSPQSIVGYSGIEEYYDAQLRGTEGGLQIEVNNRGQQVRLLGYKQPSQGKDIVLSIDSDIQQMAFELLEGRPGSMIVMDMDSGEVLGMMSSPSYDPNIFVDEEKRRRSGSLFVDPLSPLINRAIRGLFPPGSVFKIPVAICGLDSKKISQNTTFTCPGHFNLGGIRFGCTHVHGSQNLIQAIAHSCNVYFYSAGLILESELMSRYAQMFGLGKKTEIDLPFEMAGRIPSAKQRAIAGRKRWFRGDTVNMSIGQGDVLVTPLELVKMMAIIGRDGRDIQPHLIKAIGSQNIDKYSSVRELPIDKDAFSLVQKGLRATVSDNSGTAHALDLPRLNVAGKTGTAQSTAGKDHHAWFVGYAKGENRNIAFCVFLEHGGSSHNAVIIARELLLQMQGQELL